MPTGSDKLCATCGRFMVAQRNGVVVEEVDEERNPYKLWHADLYECPECGGTVIVGFAAFPYAEHYQPDYPEKKARAIAEGLYFEGRCRAKDS